MFQEPLLLRGTVGYNASLGLALRGVGKAEREARVRSVLEQLGIDHLADRSIGTLSGGEAQRTSLARALVLDPELLFLDEPFAALDQPTRRRLVRDLAGLLRERRQATVLVSHDFQEASTLCSRCAILDAGVILENEAPSRLEQSQSPRVREILGVEGSSS
jgi:tungstate transport system ATP-binding protein